MLSPVFVYHTHNLHFHGELPAWHVYLLLHSSSNQYVWKLRGGFYSSGQHTSRCEQTGLTGSLHRICDRADGTDWRNALPRQEGGSQNVAIVCRRPALSVEENEDVLTAHSELEHNSALLEGARVELVPLCELMIPN